MEGNSFMKKSKITKSVLLPLCAFAIVGSLVACNGGGSDKGQPDEYGVYADDGGPELMIKLHTHLLDKHTNYTTYASVNSYVQVSSRNAVSIDQYGNDASKIELFYTSKTYASTTGASGHWNREHVWACASSANLWTHDKSAGSHYVDGNGYTGGGSDLFHIRPCDSELNTDRGSGKFYEFQPGDECYEIGDKGGIYKLKVDKTGGFSTKCEPANEYKGDIARILMYLYVHYSKIGDNSKYSAKVQDYLGGLNLRSVFNGNYSLEQVQQLMVKWNNLDPVSDTEKNRNNTVEKIQGNRNPFVDHPEYMARCFSIE